MTALWDELQDIVGDHYRLVRELPQGGMSRLFLAVEERPERRVVIKVLPPELACRASVERFEREVGVMVQLQHPHILPVLSAGGRGDVLFYVTPFVDGETLRQRLARDGPLPPAEAARVLGEVVETVAFAHARGVAHRDLKPDNVFLVDGHAVLADFGVARALGATALPRDGTDGADGGVPGAAASSGAVAVAARGAPAYAPAAADLAVTGSQTLLGTPGYIPPEGWAYPMRGDVYALAVLGVELLTGRRGLPVAPQALGVALSGRGRAAEALGLPNGTPDAVARALARGLSAEPGARFADAGEMREALALAVPAPPPPGPWSSRRAVALGVAAGCAAYAGVWLSNDPQPPRDEYLVAVAPFDAVDPSLARWREGISESLYHSLDGAGPLHTVSPSSFILAWKGRADAASAKTLARRTGANYVVLGKLGAFAGDSVRVQAWLYNTRADAIEFDVEVRGLRDRIELLPDSLTLALVAELRLRASRGRQPLLGSRSMPAYKAFLNGEHYYRRNQWDSAQIHYERALTLDSTFALALNRMRAVLRRHDEFGVASLDFARRAGRHNTGLGVKDSLLIAADSVLASVASLPDRTPGRGAEVRRMIALFEQAAWRDSIDADVWSQLGEAIYHFGPEAGIPYTRALPAFRRALAVDSAFAPVYYHAIELSAWPEGGAGMPRLVDQYVAINPGDTAIHALRKLLTRGAPALGAVDGLLPHQLSRAEYLLHRWVDSTDAAISVTRRLVADSVAAVHALGTMMTARRVLALDLLYRGRAREAAQVLTPADLRANAALATQLMEFDALPRAQFAELADGWRRNGDVRALTLAAPMLAHTRDTAALATLGRLCATAPRPLAVTSDLTPDCVYGALAARGYLAIALDDTLNAVPALSAIPDTTCVTVCSGERTVRAELLARAGYAAQAAALLDRFPPPARRTGLPMSRWLLARAHVAARLGDHATATASTQRLRALWAYADPELRAMAIEHPRSK